MAKLQDILLDPTRRPQILGDCVALIDTEVSQKGGLTGLAVKGAYAIVKKVKPGIVHDAVDKLIDDFVQQLEPFYADFLGQSGSLALEPFLQSRAAQIANALLHVTDARAAKADNRTIKSAYDKLRPTGARHVEAAVPGIARVLSRHLKTDS